MTGLPDRLHDTPRQTRIWGKFPAIPSPAQLENPGTPAPPQRDAPRSAASTRPDPTGARAILPLPGGDPADAR